MSRNVKYFHELCVQILKCFISFENGATCFAAHTAMNIAEIAEGETVLFRQQCLKCYTAIILKFKGQSPVKYGFVREFCCLISHHMM